MHDKTQITSPHPEISYGAIQTSLNRIEVGSSDLTTDYKHLHAVYNQDSELKCLSDFNLDDNEKQDLKNKILQALEDDYLDRLCCMTSQAFNILKQKKYQEAISLYRELINYKYFEYTQPAEYAETMFNLAECYNQHENYQHSKKYFLLAKKAYNKNSDKSKTKNEISNLEEIIKCIDKKIKDSKIDLASTSKAHRFSPQSEGKKRKQQPKFDKPQKKSDDTDFIPSDTPLNDQDAYITEDDKYENPTKIRKFNSNNGFTSTQNSASFWNTQPSLVNSDVPVTSSAAHTSVNAKNTDLKTTEVALNTFMETQTFAANSYECAFAQNKTGSDHFLTLATNHIKLTCIYARQSASQFELHDHDELKKAEKLRIPALHLKLNSFQSSKKTALDCLALIRDSIELCYLYAKKNDRINAEFYCTYAINFLINANRTALETPYTPTNQTIKFT
jgi:hypothetical protein